MNSTPPPLKFWTVSQLANTPGDCTVRPTAPAPAFDPSSVRPGVSPFCEKLGVTRISVGCVIAGKADSGWITLPVGRLNSIRLNGAVAEPFG